MTDIESVVGDNGHDGTWTSIPYVMKFDVHYKAIPSAEVRELSDEEKQMADSLWDVFALPCTDGGEWFSPHVQCGQMAPFYAYSEGIYADTPQEAIAIATST